MFGRGRIKPGDCVFVVQKDGDFNNLIIGRVSSTRGNKIGLRGTIIRPTGLIERVTLGRSDDRRKDVLKNPDPNNCIFMLIDRVETEAFSDEIDQDVSKTVWINEKRFFVLDGWIRENIPDLFAQVLRANTSEERSQAREILLGKMNSMYEKDLKEHLYAVARSTSVL